MMPGAIKKALPFLADVRAEGRNPSWPGWRCSWASSSPVCSSSGQRRMWPERCRRPVRGVRDCGLKANSVHHAAPNWKPIPSGS